MKRLILLILLVLSVVAFTSACGGEEEAQVVNVTTYTVNSTYVTSTQAYVEGSFDTMLDATMVYYGFQAGTTTECDDILVGPIATTQASKWWDYLSNLQPNTKYYYRAYVEFPVRVYYGSVESFTTKP